LLDTVGSVMDLVACPLTPIEEARGRAGPTDGDDYPEKKISPLPAYNEPLRGRRARRRGGKLMEQKYGSISPQGGQSPLLRFGHELGQRGDRGPHGR
jgi:hypothetical protein